jgi:hypothetical protein
LEQELELDDNDDDIVSAIFGSQARPHAHATQHHQQQQLPRGGMRPPTQQQLPQPQQHMQGAGRGSCVQGMLPPLAPAATAGGAQAPHKPVTAAEVGSVLGKRPGAPLSLLDDLVSDELEDL